MKRFMITGGAGFIGSAIVRYLIQKTKHCVVAVDKLTYAGNLASLNEIEKSERFFFEQIDICNRTALDRSIARYQPDYIMHLAAETHVDRSIDNSWPFIKTNIVGTWQILEATRHYWYNLSKERKSAFVFHHISTDEVFGDLCDRNYFFTEDTPYAPSSPYSASKASSDHLVRAWMRTYGIPVIITNCSNNYGPYHFPEKFIPLMIVSALTGNILPLYGRGEQVRDWIYVEDHVRALITVITQGKAGETYNIGCQNEQRNIDVLKILCDLLDEMAPSKLAGVTSYRNLITFVSDRLGHDFRYAITASKIERELGWHPQETLTSGLRKTVQWYLNNESWWRPIFDNRT